MTERITITIELCPRWFQPVTLWLGVAGALLGFERMAGEIVILGYRAVKV